MHSLMHIAVFMRVVETGSFTAAARQLGISKPTVSKHIATLEAHLGARLINRTTRSLGLTEIGSHFHRHCEKIMAELEAAESEVSRFSDTPRGRLRIAAPTVIGDRQIASRLGDFLELYPEIEVELTSDNRPLDLIKEGIDLSVRMAREAPSGLASRYLAPVVHLVCGAPAYFERHGRPERPTDLTDHNCLTSSDFSAGDVWRLDGPVGVESIRVSGRMSANDGDALRTALLSGLGLALMPTFLVEEDLRGGRLRNALPGYQAGDQAIYAVYPESNPVSLKVRVFVDFLAAQLSGLKDGDPSVPGADGAGIKEAV